jgi:hypothetical protein
MNNLFYQLKIADVPTISQTRNLLMLEAPKQHDFGYTIKPLPPIPSSAGNERRVTSAPAKTHDREDDVSNNLEASRSSDVDCPTKTEGQSSCADDSSFFTPRENVVSPEERVFLTQVQFSLDTTLLF